MLIKCNRCSNSKFEVWVKNGSMCWDCFEIITENENKETK